MSVQRLPTPGQDQGNWGEILNDYLLVAHNNDGTLKAESIILSKADDNTVVHKSTNETISGSKTFLINPIVPSPTSALHVANKTYVDSAVQTKANTSSLSSVATSGSYNDLTDKPSIADDTSVVKLAGSQTVTGAKDFTGGLKLSGQTVVVTDDARLTDSRIPNDNSVSTSKVQDDSITELKLAISNAPSNGNVLTWDGSALNWAAQTASPVQSVAGKTGTITLVKGDVSLSDVDNTSDTNKPISSATQTALNAKANSTDLATVAVTGSYVNLSNKPSIPDDSTLVHLTDARLSDTRTPSDDTVSTSKIQNESITEPKLSISNSPTGGDVLSWNGTALAWETQANAPVQSVAGKTGSVTLTKADVGLTNADDSSDANKPVSVATQTALDAKANSTDLATVAVTGSYANLNNKPSIPDDSSLVHLGDTQAISGAKDFTGGLKMNGTAVVSTDDVRLSNNRTPSDDTVTSAKLHDDSVTEPKLAISNAPAGGNILTWNGTALAWGTQNSVPVQSVAGKTGVVSLVKADVGLPDVDNTADAAKPISTATSTALSSKQDTSLKGQVSGYASLDTSTLVPRSQLGSGVADATKVLFGDGTWGAQPSAPVSSVAGKMGAVTLVKGDVSLGNVDNTTDAAKPVSSATQTALNAKANSTDLATVAITGSYVSLSNKPTLSTVAATGTYSDLLGIPANLAIVRSFNSISGDTNAGAAAHTDYVYNSTASLVLTLPTAVGNANSYTVKNSGTNAMSIVTTASQTIDGSSTISVTANRAYVLYSDNTNWIVT